MEIRNTTPANQSIHATRGTGISVQPVLTIPGDGAIYISDELFEKHYARECEAQCKAGIFKIGLDTVESEDDVLIREAAELKAAIALVAKFAAQDKLKDEAAAVERQADHEAAEEAKVEAAAAEKSRLATAGVASVKGEPKV